MIYNLLLCLGDSLTCGARDRYMRNYPLELAKELSEITSEEWYSITEAVNGRTSSELATSAYSIVNKYPDVYGVILLIGTNDSRNKFPVEVYIDNVKQIIRVCRILRKKIYLLSIPPFFYHRHFLWYDKQARLLIDEYNEKLSEMENVVFIDLNKQIEENDLIDGVHFTHEANVKIAKFLAKSLLTI
jgi:lysophospholipase L1-like esterase